MNLLLRTFIAFIALTSCAFAHSSAFKPAYVDSLLAPYFKIQEALVLDKFAPAIEAAKGFEAVLAEGPSAEQAPSMARLGAAIRAVKSSEEIEAARVAFHTLSKEMILTVDHVGVAKTTAYQMRCSMAFNNTGASWLQATDELLNPYWGARMLRCGHEEVVYKPGK